MILKTILYNNYDHENHLTNRQGGFLIPKIESGYAGADGKPAATLLYHDPAGGPSGSIHTVDGLLKNHVQEDYA